MVYDDFASGRHAMEIYHRLISQFDGKCEFRLRDWTIGLLRNHALNDIAIQEATDAQVIIIALGGEELPPAVKKWVEGWRVYRSAPHAILSAFLTCRAHADGSYPVEDYLRHSAADCGREFLIEKSQPWVDWCEVPPKAVSSQKPKLKRL